MVTYWVCTSATPDPQLCTVSTAAAAWLDTNLLAFIVQQGDAEASPSSPIVLDDATQTPMASQAHPPRHDHHQHQEPGTRQLQTALASGTGARFGPHFNAPSGYSPGVPATAAFASRFTAAAGNSPFARSPSVFAAVQPKSAALTLRQRVLSSPKDPNGELGKLMEALQMHRPYTSESHLEAVPSKQRETVASVAQLDLEEVIARHVCLHGFAIGCSRLLCVN